MFEKDKRSELLTVIAPRVNIALNLLQINADIKSICDFFEKIRLIERNNYQGVIEQSKQLGFDHLEDIPHSPETPLIWAPRHTFPNTSENAYIPAELGIAVVTSIPYNDYFSHTDNFLSSSLVVKVNYVPVILMILSEHKYPFSPYYSYETHYKDVPEYQKPAVRNHAVRLSSTYLAPLPRTK